jgi:hypothetical protein
MKEVLGVDLNYHIDTTSPDIATSLGIATSPRTVANMTVDSKITGNMVTKTLDENMRWVSVHIAK